MADTWLDGEFNTVKALHRLSEGQRSEIGAAVEAADAKRRPMAHDRMVQRLTALGMVMSPNRPPAEASMWVREVSRLLQDIPEDLLCGAIDQLQCKLKFLPTVAEIRELADPELERRHRQFQRLDAMRRFIESGQPLPRIEGPKKPLLDRRGETMSEEDCNELNRILENMGACSRYRPDGSRFNLSEPVAKKPRYDRPQMPTRQDYLDMGVDPAVLDRIEAEKHASVDRSPEGGDRETGRHAKHESAVPSGASADARRPS